MSRRTTSILWLSVIFVFLFLSPDASCKSPLRAQHALGLQRILVLAVIFPNVEPDKSLSEIRNHVLEKTARYYAAASHGKTRITGEIKGWYRLPLPLDDYKIAPYNIKVDRRRVRMLVEDTLDAAAKDVEFKHFDHIVIVVGVRTRPGQGYGMIAYSANPGIAVRGRWFLQCIIHSSSAPSARASARLMLDVFTPR